MDACVPNSWGTGYCRTTERGGQRPMTTLNAPEAPVLEGQAALPDFTTEAYKDAYSRILSLIHI